MSGPEYGPKLIEESKYDSVCALCANEIPIGSPLWWFNKNCYCMEHSKAEVMTDRPAVSAPMSNPSPSGHPSPEFWKDEIVELNRNLDRIVSAIDNLSERLRR